MAIKAPDLRQHRALLMLQDKVMGMKNHELATKYAISMLTVERELKWGREQGVIQSHADKIMANLVPKALVAIEVALTNNDSNVALEILKGMNILKKQGTAEPPPPQDEDSLEFYMKIRKPSDERVLPPVVTSSVDQRSLSPALLQPIDLIPFTDGETIDGESDCKTSG